MSKKEYTSPAITVVTFHSERGFALSIQSEALVHPIDNYIEMMMYDSQDNNMYRETETFIEHDSWNEQHPDSFW